MQVQMMENNIDFTSDDPMDQKGLFTFVYILAFILELSLLFTFKFCLHFSLLVRF